MLVLLGALTKSAQFPFHFWLPHAMAAPTPVSAYLHSATMVKAGRVPDGAPVAGAGRHRRLVLDRRRRRLVTLLLGAYVAIFQHDLKGLLAYSTISHLGLITLLLGLNSPLAAVAAIFHMMNHATFKASLFMAVGIIDHETGTRDIRRLCGLYRVMPITATLAIVAGAAMAGVPLLNGFLSKEMFFAETLDVDGDAVVDRACPIVATVAGVFSVAYSLRFIHGVFFGPLAEDCRAHAARAAALDAVPGRAAGAHLRRRRHASRADDRPVSRCRRRAGARCRPPRYSLAVWHGFTLPLLMSVVALAGGVAALLRCCNAYFARGAEGTPLLHRLEGRRMFEPAVALSLALGAVRWSACGTARLQPQLRWWSSRSALPPGRVCSCGPRARRADGGAVRSGFALAVDRRRRRARSAPPGRPNSTGLPP